MLQRVFCVVDVDHDAYFLEVHRAHVQGLFFTSRSDDRGDADLVLGRRHQQQHATALLLLAEHPTFAVNLKPVHPDYGIAMPEGKYNQQGRVFLPENNSSGRIRFWPGPNDHTPIGGLVGFLGSIRRCCRNYVNNSRAIHGGNPLHACLNAMAAGRTIPS